MEAKNLADKDQAFILEQEKKELSNRLKDLTGELNRFIENEAEIQTSIIEHVGEYNESIMSKDFQIEEPYTMNELLVELGEHDLKKSYVTLLEPAKTFESFMQQILIYVEKFTQIILRIKELTQIDKANYLQVTTE